MKIVRGGTRPGIRARMTRRGRLTLMLGCCLLTCFVEWGLAQEDQLLPFPVANGKKEESPDGKAEPVRVQPGMTAAEVQKRLGRPTFTARQILYRRYLEQWSFEAPISLLVEIECIKGQEPRILSVRPLH